MNNLWIILIVGAGGFLGSIARYLTTLAVDRKFNSFFPFGTLVVNIAGAFLLGLIAAYMLKRTGNGFALKMFLTTGFCGGFTTFSAFALENMLMVQQKLTMPAVLYSAVSLLLGIGAVWLGSWVGKMLV